MPPVSLSMPMYYTVVILALPFFRLCRPDINANAIPCRWRKDCRRYAYVAFHRAALGDFQLSSFEQRCAFSFWRVEQDFYRCFIGCRLYVGCGQSTGFRLVLDHHAVEKSPVQRIGRGRQSRVVI